MLENAVETGADTVIFDLEDAVAPGAKAEARRTVRATLDALDDPAPTIAVRINPYGMGGRADVDAIVDAWVALASDQRTHGSHLLAEENRSTVREHVTHHVVGDRIFVARTDGSVIGFVQFSTEVGSYRLDVDRGVVERRDGAYTRQSA